MGSALLTVPDDAGTLTKALALLTDYGRDKYSDALIPFRDAEQFKHDSLIKNRSEHGDRIAGTYGKLPAILGLVPAAGYEVVKSMALKKGTMLNDAAKDTLMYVGRSPFGAAGYRSEPDAHANDPRTTEMFTIDDTTRSATPEAVAAYGRGVMEANAPLVRPQNLVDALAGIFGKGGVK